jgi:HK97 gp10 family phage protein
MKPVIKLDTKVLDKIIAQQVDEAGRIVRGAAFSIEGHAKNKAPVDTGALKSSLTAEKKRGVLRWWVHDGVEYGIYQELGTSRMSAQPFLIPAVEAVRPAWDRKWREFFARWK